MKKLFSCIIAAFFILGCVLIGAQPGFAQQEDEDTFVLEEITVTAEKREVNVQKTALSVTAVTGANIRDQANNTLEDVLRNIASVEVAYANRGGQINIRGIGSYVDTSMADPAVAVIEDNIYNGNSLATFGNMYDIERVEVLRGPQGTLYGRNASGGTINVISQKPLHEFQLTGNLQIGDYNLKHFDGAVNFPISDNLAGRVAVLRETRDGYGSSGDMDNNVLGARAKVLWEPSENLSVLATYEYFWEQDHGTNTVPIPGSAGNLPWLAPPFDGTGGYTKPDYDRDGVADDFLMPDAGGALVPGSDGIGDLMQTGWVVPEGADPWTNDEWHPGGFLYADKKAYSLQVDWDMGWGVLTVLPSYADSYNHNRDDHLAGTSRNPGFEYTQNQENERQQTSGEVRIASPAESDWTWIAGYYYMKSDNSSPFAQDPTTYYDNLYHTASKRNPIVSTALFGQTTIPLTDWFRVTGGIRASSDDEDRDYRIGLSTPVGEVLYDTGWLNYNSDVSSTTYKGGVEFDLAEDSMLYAQVATGFKQGGLNMTAPPTTFEPEELTAYEVGMKNRFFDNRMQLNFELFHYKYENMQAQMGIMAPIGDTGAMDFAMAILNAKEGTLKGLDIELDYLATQNDRLSVSGSFLDSEVGEFIIPPGPFYPEPYDMTGRQMSSSPEWAFTVAYEHTWLLDNGATVTSRIDSKISDGYYATLEHFLPYAWQDGYHRSNANLTYRSGDGKWSVSAWGKNLENDAQYTWTVPFYRGMIKAPRTVGVNVSYRY